MDDRRFDDLSRFLGTAASRQSIVRVLAGLGAAGLAALTGADVAAKKGRGHKGQSNERKRKRKKRRGGRVSAQAALCPGNQDKVCHCAPGSLGNCGVTGNGGGHSGDPLDCCCTINGAPNPDCSCTGNSCCKPADTACANSGQCCEGLSCCDIVDGIGACQAEACCIPETCAADHPGVCGTFPDGCGGEITCCGDDPACCGAGQACSDSTCCTPLTCADNPGGCGAFDPGCGFPVIECACAVGTCCGTICVDGSECCASDDCAAQLCQAVECDNGVCDYSPVGDNQPGPLCDNEGLFCCNGDECCEPDQVCTPQGCCTPQTCADELPGQCGTLAQGCGLPDLECCGADPACCEAGQACVDSTCCTPLTCADFAGLCGPQDDGCGGQTADCACPAGETCNQGACSCVPQTQEEACAGSNVECGIVSDGCGGEYDCGGCRAGDSCIAGVCLARRGKRKRCKGTGKAGHPCKGKKCKCKAGRRCHKGKCCETVGDGSRHCNADSDCCPGLQCRRRMPDQHKVCVRKPVNTQGVTPAP